MLKIKHITVRRIGDENPQPVPSYENHFQCPFCSPELYKSAGYAQIATHLASHKLRAIHHGDFLIYGCGLGCDGKAKHFHCHYCSKTYVNRKEMIKHLDRHCTNAPRQPAATVPGPSTSVPPAAATPGPSASVSPATTPCPSTSVPPAAATPGPSASVSPAATPGPSASVSPAATPGPSASVSPAATPGPSASVSPATTPGPSTSVPFSSSNTWSLNISPPRSNNIWSLNICPPQQQEHLVPQHQPLQQQQHLVLQHQPPSTAATTPGPSTSVPPAATTPGPSTSVPPSSSNTWSLNISPPSSSNTWSLNISATCSNNTWSLNISPHQQNQNLVPQHHSPPSTAATPSPLEAPSHIQGAHSQPQSQHSEKKIQKCSIRAVVMKKLSVQCPHCNLTVNKRNLNKHIERRHTHRFMLTT